MKRNERDKIIDSPYFSYLLIRDHLLTNILGDEASEILYWGGKELARQFSLTQYEDISGAFNHCGFGELTMLKNNVFRLSGELVRTRLLSEQANFQLEAGFLAEQFSRIHKRPAEVQVTLQAKEVEFTIFHS